MPRLSLPLLALFVALFLVLAGSSETDMALSTPIESAVYAWLLRLSSMLSSFNMLMSGTADLTFKLFSAATGIFVYLALAAFFRVLWQGVEASFPFFLAHYPEYMVEAELELSYGQLKAGLAYLNLNLDALVWAIFACFIIYNCASPFTIAVTLVPLVVFRLYHYYNWCVAFSVVKKRHATPTSSFIGTILGSAKRSSDANATTNTASRSSWLPAFLGGQPAQPETPVEPQPPTPTQNETTSYWSYVTPWKQPAGTLNASSVDTGAPSLSSKQVRPDLAVSPVKDDAPLPAPSVEASAVPSAEPEISYSKRMSDWFYGSPVVVSSNSTAPANPTLSTNGTCVAEFTPVSADAAATRIDGVLVPKSVPALVEHDLQKPVEGERWFHLF